jgi:hypothetical protein
MPWIRFWSQTNTCKNPSNEYEWIELVLSDDAMEDLAREAAPNYIKSAYHPYQFGWEVLDKLPENIKNSFINKYKRQISEAETMIQILLDS